MIITLTDDRLIAVDGLAATFAVVDQSVSTKIDFEIGDTMLAEKTQAMRFYGRWNATAVFSGELFRVECERTSVTGWTATINLSRSAYDRAFAEARSEVVYLTATALFVITEDDDERALTFPIELHRSAIVTTDGEEVAEVSKMVVRAEKAAIASANSALKAKESADAAALDLSGVKKDLNNLKEVVKPATTKKLGTVKLGTANTTNNGGPVGLDNSGQMRVPVAGGSIQHPCGVIRVCTKTYAPSASNVGWSQLTNNYELVIMPPGEFNRYGVVRIADDLDDTHTHACPTAAQVKEGLMTKADVDHTHPLLSDLETTQFVVVQENGTWIVKVAVYPNIPPSDFDRFGKERPLTAKKVAEQISILKGEIAQLQADIKNLQNTNSQA